MHTHIHTHKHTQWLTHKWQPRAGIFGSQACGKDEPQSREGEGGSRADTAIGKQISFTNDETISTRAKPKRGRERGRWKQWGNTAQQTRCTTYVTRAWQRLPASQRETQCAREKERERERESERAGQSEVSSHRRRLIEYANCAEIIHKGAGTCTT